MKYSLNFPSNWIRKQNSNKHATHTFNVIENGKINLVMITISKFQKIQQSFLETPKYVLEMEINIEKDHIAEKDIVVESFVDNNKHIGYYYKATDTNWKKDCLDDWPCVLRCLYTNENINVELSVLCFDMNCNTIKQAIDMLKTSK